MRIKRTPRTRLFNPISEVATGVLACRRAVASRPADNRTAGSYTVKFQNRFNFPSFFPGGETPALYGRRGRPPLHRGFLNPNSRFGLNRTGGFTLIELLLVLVILGILAAIVIPKFSGRTEQARVTAAVSQISTFGTALDAFEIDNGFYPKGKNGLNDLVNKPGNAQNWRGPYLQKGIPDDPWNHPYIYENPGKHNPSGYDVMSIGPDGRAGTDDDITNWQTKK